MSSARFAVLGFRTTHDAMRAEAALLGAGVGVMLVPTPKELGTLCGLAARVPIDEADSAASALEAEGISVDARIDIEDRVSAERDR